MRENADRPGHEILLICISYQSTAFYYLYPAITGSNTDLALSEESVNLWPTSVRTDAILERRPAEDVRPPTQGLRQPARPADQTART